MTNRPAQEDISIRAYQIYLSRGGAHGSDQQDWFRAERELTDAANEAQIAETATLRQAGIHRNPKAGHAITANPPRIESGGRGTRD